MDGNELERIKEFLFEQSVDINSVSNSRINQFIKLDIAIQKRFEELKSVAHILEKSEINILDISLESNISRKTFYNNLLLKKYVEKYSEVYSQEHSSIFSNYIRNNNDEELNKLRNYNALLDREVRELVSKDIDYELLRLQNDGLLNEIKNLQRNISALENEYAKVKKELNDTKAKFSS